ncbi:MAG: hypothetical protein QOF49_1901, partial [Chloroflexota bacterium]|nr:hypothetical protein [Chloroflexota bacterium]
DQLRGRISSINTLVVAGGPRVGDIEAAAVASVIGAQASVVTGGLLVLVGLVGVVRLFPELVHHVHPLRSDPERPADPLPTG